jgi:hypothetical protein
MKALKEYDKVCNLILSEFSLSTDMPPEEFVRKLIQLEVLVANLILKKNKQGNIFLHAGLLVI